MTNQPSIAFIGLGNMGGGIAANLIRAGFDVTLYNRTPEKLAPLLEIGGKAADSGSGRGALGLRRGCPRRVQQPHQNQVDPSAVDE